MKNLFLSLLVLIPASAGANHESTPKRYMITAKQVVHGSTSNSVSIAVVDGQNATAKSSFPSEGNFTRFQVKPQSLSDGRVHLDIGFRHKSEKRATELVTELILTPNERIQLPMNGDPALYLEIEAKAL
jgi:hypothetical protein